MKIILETLSSYGLWKSLLCVIALQAKRCFQKILPVSLFVLSVFFLVVLSQPSCSCLLCQFLQIMPFAYKIFALIETSSCRAWKTCVKTSNEQLTANNTHNTCSFYSAFQQISADWNSQIRWTCENHFYTLSSRNQTRACHLDAWVKALRSPLHQYRCNGKFTSLTPCFSGHICGWNGQAVFTILDIWTLRRVWSWQPTPSSPMCSWTSACSRSYSYRGRYSKFGALIEGCRPERFPEVVANSIPASFFWRYSWITHCHMASTCFQNACSRGLLLCCLLDSPSDNCLRLRSFWPFAVLLHFSTFSSYRSAFKNLGLGQQWVYRLMMPAGADPSCICISLRSSFALESLLPVRSCWTWRSWRGYEG